MADQEIRDWLDAHVNLEQGLGVPSDRRVSAPTLDRMRALAEWLGSPNEDLAATHITGTNGKTSTARMCVALLSELGLRVGSYTSPHLERVNERLAIDGEPVDDEALDEVLDAVRRVEPQLVERLSYFEILTGAAFRWFVDEAVDVAVVEVGLGGRWDATNIIDARVAVVTNVGIDHVEYLGPTREGIAAEKAGIVKADSRLVLGETDPDIQRVFLDRNPPSVARRDFEFGTTGNRLAVGGRLLDLYTPRGDHNGVFLPLHGAHQGDNAAIALAAAEELVDVPFSDAIVHEALGRVQSPGRLEVLQRNPLVVLDGAHNVAGAELLVSSLAEEFPVAPRTLVVGLLREKEPHEMLQALDVRGANRLVVCRPPSPRGRDPQDVMQAALDLGVDDDDIDVCETVREAVGAAVLATPAEGQIVITWTLYVVGAARSILLPE